MYRRTIGCSWNIIIIFVVGRSRWMRSTVGFDMSGTFSLYRDDLLQIFILHIGVSRIGYFAWCCLGTATTYSSALTKRSTQHVLLWQTT